jgi:ankyrin repeat protein
LFFIRGIDGVFSDAKVDFQARDKEGNTPLLIAAKTGTQDVFAWLEKKGANLDATNNQGESARVLMAHSNNSTRQFRMPDAETDLIQAVREGKADAALSLLKADPQLVNQPDKSGQTPLRVAVMQHQTNMLDLLETHGAKWDEGSAVMAGRADALQTILHQNPSAVGTMVQGRGLIHIAAANGNVNMVSLLIAANADTQAGDRWGISPLGYALLKKHPDAEAVLLQHGAKENIFDAVYADDLKTAATLLGNDHTLASSRNRERVSVLDVAVATGRTNLIKLLLKNDADFTSVGRNPLQVAAFYDQPEALALLIHAGAKVNRLDLYGFAPLHWAAIRGGTAAAAMLLKHKADVDQAAGPITQRLGFMMQPGGAAFTGDTPLHLAALYGETNMVELLLKSKADPNAVNAAQLTPLGAMENRNIFMIAAPIDRVPLRILEPIGVGQAPTNQNPAMMGAGRKAVRVMLEAAGGRR